MNPRALEVDDEPLIISMIYAARDWCDEQGI